MSLISFISRSRLGIFVYFLLPPESVAVVVVLPVERDYLFEYGMIPFICRRKLPKLNDGMGRVGGERSSYNERERLVEKV